VKGLGATKVTSLVDAFTKPFLVGGLKRGDSNQTGETTVSTRIDGPGAAELEAAGSPEWPEEDVDEEGVSERAVGRGRERVRSRSVEEMRNGAEENGRTEESSADGAWKDPLDDDEEDEEVYAEAGDGGPSRKRARVGA